MARVGSAVKAFLDGTAGAYERLLNRAVDDGIAHAQALLQVDVRIDPVRRDAVVRRLVRYYLPSLTKMHNELLGLAATEPARVDAWFARNGYRIEMAIEGLVWAGGEAGLALAAGNEQLWWNIDNGVSQHCGVCPVFEEGSPYNLASLPAFPGDGTTPCGGQCYCYLTLGAPSPDA